jgi:hypothetical protein
VESLTAQTVQSRLSTIITDLSTEPEAQGVTPIEAVALLAEVERYISAAVAEAAAEAQSRGHSLTEIGNAMGTTRQNVWNRLDRAGGGS